MVVEVAGLSVSFTDSSSLAPEWTAIYMLIIPCIGQDFISCFSIIEMELGFSKLR